MFTKTLHMLMPLALAIAPLTAAEWMTDFEAAKTKAAQENKAILMDFTGSDWCTWCIKLRKEVLDKPEFDAYAKDKFVLVEVDVPQNPAKLTPEQRTANEALCKQFKISGFPTLIVTDAKGEVIGGFGGFRPTVEAVEEPLNAALAVEAKLKEAAGLEGDAKLAALTEAYKNIPGEMRELNPALGEEIAKLDTNDSTGVKHAAEVRAQQQQIAAEVNACADEAAALAVIDKWAEQCFEENRFELLYNKTQMMIMSAKTVADLDAAEKVGYQAIEALPAEDQADARKGLEKVFADKEALLQKLQSRRAR